MKKTTRSQNHTHPHRLLSLSVFAFLVPLTGCSTLQPDLKLPPAPVAMDWQSGSKDQLGSDTDRPWQDMVRSERARSLVELALVQNRDLRIAALNVQRAQAQYRIQRAALLPEVDGVGTGSSQRAQAPNGSGESSVSRTYSADLSVVAWELDLFGRVASLKDAALQDYLSTEAAQRATRLSVVAQVLGSYVQLCADLQRQQLAQETLASRQASYQLQNSLNAAGLSSSVELRRAKTELHEIEDQTLEAVAAAARSRNTLELVVGSPLGTVEGEPIAGILTDVVPGVGVPSDLLYRRPDILAAEHQLRAANANIGSARAAFFPSITLTGSFGSASQELSGLFDGGTRAWSFIPQLHLPIFNGGRLRASLKVAKVDRDRALADYEKAIQTSFREVSDVLADQAVIGDRVRARRDQVVSADEVLDAIGDRYEAGVSDQLELLDAQRGLYSSQRSLVSAESRQVQIAIDLYRTLGGNWAADQVTPVAKTRWSESRLERSMP